MWFPQIWIGCALAVVALLLFATTLWRVPKSLQIADSSSRTDSEPVIHLSRSMHMWLLRRTWQPMGLMVAGCFAFPGASLMNMGAISMVTGSFMALQVLREVAHLPIRRITVLAYIVLPSLVWAFVGLASSTVVFRYYNGLREYRNDVWLSGEWGDGGWKNVKVPPHLWEFSRGNAPIRVTSPSGESATLVQYRLFPKLSVSVYNPYSVDRNSSCDFAAWQLSRAIAKVYRVEISPSELMEKHLTCAICKNGTGNEFGGNSLGVKATAPPSLAAVRVVQAVALWFVAMLFVIRANRPAGSRRELHRGYFKIGIVAVLLLAFLIFPAAISISMTFNGSAEAEAVAARILSECLPKSTLVTALGVVALFMACFAVLYKRFARVEVPANKAT